MGGYNDLKTAIIALIRTNDNQEITGATLQSALLSIINTIGQGSVFKGVATTSTNPGSPDASVFYIAGRPGYYPNFNLELTAGLHVIENKSGTWVNTEIALDVVDAINIGGAKHVKPSQAMIVALQSVEQIPDSEGLANKMWWSTDGHLKYRHNDTVYDLGNPAYVLYYCGDKIYKWTGSGFREIGGGGTFASGEAVSNMSVFDDGSDTDGKSSSQLAAMIPSGEVIKSLLEIISSIDTSGGSYDGVDLITTFSYNASTRVITVKQSGRQAKTITLPLANSTNAGLMSSDDKIQLANLQNLIGKTVKSFNKSTSENGITITLTTYDDTPYTVLIPNSEIDPSILAGKADKFPDSGMLTPSQWPHVMLYNIESMWGAGGTSPDYASIPVGSIYLDESDSISNPPYKRLFYKKTIEGTSQRIDLGAPQENTIYCHTATGKLYRWIPTQNGNDGAFQQVGGDLILPHIGQNGNWWVGPETDSNNDTGIRAQGPQGEAGNCMITGDGSNIIALIVNDLVTGGSGNILSAEQGRELRYKIEEVYQRVKNIYSLLGNIAFWGTKPAIGTVLPDLNWNVPKQTVTLSLNLINAVVKHNGVEKSNNSTIQVEQGSTLILTVEPSSGYALTTVRSSTTGASVEDNGDGTYSVSIVIGNSDIVLSITANASAIAYPITYNFEQCSKVSGPTAIVSGGSATIVLQADSNYKMPSSLPSGAVTGASVTSYTVDANDNTKATLVIGNATDSVTIAISAVPELNILFIKSMFYLVSVTSGSEMFAMRTSSVFSGDANRACLTVLRSEIGNNGCAWNTSHLNSGGYDQNAMNTYSAIPIPTGTTKISIKCNAAYYHWPGLIDANGNVLDAAPQWFEGTTKKEYNLSNYPTATHFAVSFKIGSAGNTRFTDETYESMGIELTFE